jgi:superfamily II DNA or RNA helicase
MDITRYGLSIPLSLFKSNKSLLRILKKKLTIKTKIFNNMYKQISCYHVKDGHIYIPPHLGKKIIAVLFKGMECKETLVLGDDIKLPESYLIMTANQTVVHDYLINNDIRSSIIQMEPGYGKTYLAMGLINTIKKKTIIVVPTLYLLKQWIAVINTCFPALTVGEFHGKVKTEGDIVITTIHSSVKYPHYDSVGFIIYDEIHMYCTKKMYVIFRNANLNRILGLTATPIRSDNFDKLATWYCGDVIYSKDLEGWEESDVKFLSKIIKVEYHGGYEHTQIRLSEAGIVSVPLMVNQLIEDDKRNEVIVEQAINLYNKGLCTFIFSDRRSHLEILASRLEEAKVCFEAPELNILMGGTSDEIIEEAKVKGKIILTTYAYSSTGVSIDKMDGLILSTPRRSNMKQILGRIFRLKGNRQSKRIIVDIVDMRTPLKAQFYERSKMYTQLTEDIEILKVLSDN